MDSTVFTHTNKLISESSPYLLQHAHNPVNWWPWNAQAWEKAKEENKLVLISIGYSACHWCHVMERESFEDDSVAGIMNEHFICIKVDREQRPDVDQVYMTAVQLMTGSGGWPLNCFTLADGRPIYGGTYFPKSNWVKILRTLSDFYKNDPKKVLQYASELTTAVKQHELIPAFSEKVNFTHDILTTCVENWKKRFDNQEGGPMKAPKFPLPNNYQFLLRQCYFSNDSLLLKHVNLTLEKMAYGGIYDQIGGGFARYSTDSDWKVPHFEKMLYDNAQLVSLYSEAYRFSKNLLYKKIVYETLDFIQREMTSNEGVFYSALDADTEGEEGKYYVWTVAELQTVFGKNMELFAAYFNVNETGYWEEEAYILLRKQSDEDIAGRFGLSVEELLGNITEMKNQLLAIRQKRVPPGVDNKILTSWNAMMIKGFTEAYKAFGDDKFIAMALKASDHLVKTLSREDGGLCHAQGINGFLEDYSFTIDAFISLYQVTFDEKWLTKAKLLAEYTILHFHDSSSAMFYFTSDLDPTLITRKMEIQDNVIPSSNSAMALSLFYLGKYLDNKRFLSLSEAMLHQVQKEIPIYGSAYSNWAMLMQFFLNRFFEIAIVGKDVDEKRKTFCLHYVPNAIFTGSFSRSTLPLLENKLIEGKTYIYVCENKTCKLPTENINEALKQVIP
jgi:uncharacterized protein